jgi:simple sugar transport system ATP-binding protein
LKVQPEAYIWQLSVGQQQRVEIIKALHRGASLLVLDEPTAVLTPQEVDELFAVMRQMAKDGHALIFISHKLHEVVEISQRVLCCATAAAGRVARLKPRNGISPAGCL